MWGIFLKPPSLWYLLQQQLKRGTTFPLFLQDELTVPQSIQRTGVHSQFRRYNFESYRGDRWDLHGKFSLLLTLSFQWKSWLLWLLRSSSFLPWVRWDGMKMLGTILLWEKPSFSFSSRPQQKKAADISQICRHWADCGLFWNIFTMTFKPVC